MSALVDLPVDQGVQFDRVLYCQDSSGAIFPLSGWSAIVVVEAQYGGTPLFTLSSPASGLVITAAAGTVAMVFTAAQTALMVLSRYLWRLDMTDPTAIPRRYLQGTVRVSPQ